MFDRSWPRSQTVTKRQRCCLFVGTEGTLSGHSLELIDPLLTSLGCLGMEAGIGTAAVDGAAAAAVHVAAVDAAVDTAVDTAPADAADVGAADDVGAAASEAVGTVGAAGAAGTAAAALPLMAIVIGAAKTVLLLLCRHRLHHHPHIFDLPCCFSGCCWLVPVAVRHCSLLRVVAHCCSVLCIAAR